MKAFQIEQQEILFSRDLRKDLLALLLLTDLLYGKQRYYEAANCCESVCQGKQQTVLHIRAKGDFSHKLSNEIKAIS